MNARFEKQNFEGTTHISAYKYKNLHNLPHWHMEYEIVFVFRGTAELMINNNILNANAGMGVFITSEDIHYIKASPGSLIGVIKADIPLINSIIGPKKLASPILKRNYYLNSVFSELSAELKENREYKRIIAESIVIKLIAEIFRNEATVVCSELSVSSKYKELLAYITKNYAHITFEDAAEYANLSKPYFSKYFQRVSGMTFTYYLNILKISAAAEKIHEGKMSITEISIVCGFGTIRNFNRVFKKFTGYTPKSLPKDYIFVYKVKSSDDIGFDPTLNCSEIIG